jgi:uncharacterized membrane protein YfcA
MEVGLLLIAGGIGAGVFGSLLGLGGGILIVPLLTLGFDLPVRDAVGVSLVCVIVTSGAAAGVYLERHVANLRLGMVLELFTASGALIGGTLAFLLDERILAGLFAVLLVYVAISMLRRGRTPPEAPPTAVPAPDPAPADSSRIGAGLGRFFAGLDGPGYRPHSPVAGAIGSVAAGVVSALLGIGGGLVKVPVLHLVMGVPLRVATATSNLMIGITASTSALIYLIHGGIHPYATGPTAVGVFVGATLGSRLSHRVHPGALRLLFVVVLLYTAYQMLRRAVSLP